MTEPLSRSWFPAAIVIAAIVNPIVVMTLWLVSPSTPGTAALAGMAASIWVGFLLAWWAVRTFGRLADAHRTEAAERERLTVALKEFASRGSHDLRTPLATARMAADMLGREELTESAQQAVGIIQRQTMRSLDLIEGLVQLARADAPIELGPVNLDVVAAELREEGLTFEAESLGTVVADRLKLTQALTAIVRNAITHGQTPVRLSRSTDGTDVVLQVTDAGPGIEDPERALMAFHRGHDAAGMGAGLGLSIAAAIARAHGGSLTIASDPTTVSIRLPDRS